jgi:hypothetical protein
MTSYGRYSLLVILVGGLGKRAYALSFRRNRIDFRSHEQDQIRGMPSFKDGT